MPNSRPRRDSEISRGSTPNLLRRLRRFLSPVHPRRIAYRLLHLAHVLGWHRLRLWLSGLSPRRLGLSARWLVAEWSDLRRRRREPLLTVAVDISPLWEPLTGIGWYLYRLLEVLAERDDVRLRLYGPDLIDRGDTPPPRQPLPVGPALEVVRHRVPRDFTIVHGWLSARLRRVEGRCIAADRNAVLFAPNYLLPPRFDGCDQGVLVATVHDLSVLKVPETMRESTRQLLGRGLRATMERAGHLLTDTEAVRQEILRAGLAPAERVHAVHLAPALGVDREGARLEGWPARYVLFVGTLEPRKNLPTLLDAFEAFYRGARGPAEDRAQLVLCGGVGWKSEQLAERLQAGRDAGWLRLEGYLAEASLAAAYRHAEWLALPSLYEGFGLPAVEAMAAGVPMLLADIPVLREVAGDAGLYAPPGDPGAWRQLLERALGDADLRRAQAAKAGQRAGRFDWRQTAEATLEVWRAAAGREARSGAGP